jgi:uncharacterized integral membrane protein (TIGR00698 family)
MHGAEPGAEIASDRAPPASARHSVIAAIPGLLLTSGIGACAFAASRLQTEIALSPILLAILLGALIRNLLGRAERFRAGVAFAQKKLLRFAIVLLGLQLTLAQIAELGVAGLAVVVAAVISCFAFTRWAGQALGVDAKLSELLAAGISICGASAVVAANTVTRARDADAVYAVACVTLFGTVAMLLAPLLALPFGLSHQDYGLWIGASIHEIAQVVAAGFQIGDAAGQTGTIAKLSRVMLLAPAVLALGYFARRRLAADRAGAGAAPPFPWFILGFAAVVAANSAVAMPTAVMAWIAPITTLLFATALAGMGLETDLRKIRAEGVRPLLLGAASSLFIAGVSLALVKLLPG